MTNPNKAELRRLAEAAAHKDWYAGNAYDKPFIRKYQIITDTPDGKYVLLDGNQNFPEHCVSNVAFVGAANPAAVLSLLDECDKAEAERDAALAELAQCRADSADVWGLAQGRADTIDELRAELEACRKDADRLDWLTKKGAEEDPEQGDVRGYIDSAMSQEVGHD